MSKITFGTIFIGREYCLDDYLDFISNAYPKEHIELLWIIRNGSNEFINGLNEFAKGYTNHIYIHLDKVIDHFCHSDSNNKLRRTRIVESYKLLFDYAKELGNDLFIVEDDVIPPYNALTKLIAIRGGYYHQGNKPSPNAIAYAGLARSVWDRGYDWYPLFRKTNSPKYFQDIKNIGHGIVEADAVGLGCVLIDREFWNYDYEPMNFMQGSTGHDKAFAKFLNSIGKTIVVDKDLRCNHYTQTGWKNILVLKEYGGKWFERYLKEKDK